MAAGTRPTAVPVYLGQLVQTGSIISPVTFFDVALPDGFSRYNFFFSGMTLTAPATGDNIAAALMTGGHFNCDNLNNDTYYLFPGGSAASLIILTPPQTDLANDSDYRAAGLLDIYAGDSQNWPFLSVTYSWAESTVSLLVQGLAVYTVNSLATIPPFHGAATMLRVLPKGNGDCNPPTSGNTINTGDWRLYAFN